MCVIWSENEQKNLLLISFQLASGSSAAHSFYESLATHTHTHIGHCDEKLQQFSSDADIFNVVNDDLDASSEGKKAHDIDDKRNVNDVSNVQANSCC